MIQDLDVSDKVFKAMINMLRGLIWKEQAACKNRNNVSRGRNSKHHKEMLEIKITVTKMKNAF